MSTLKVNNLQVGQDSTATNNLTWFQPGSPDGTIRLGSGNAGSATTKFTFDKDGNLTCVGDITANSIIAPIEGTLDDWIVHAGDSNTKFGFSTTDTFQVLTAGTEAITVNSSQKVGIGITAPLHNLHIKPATAAETVLKIEAESGYDARLKLDTSSGGGAEARIDFEEDASIRGWISYTNNSGGTTDDMVFGTATSERLRIGATGLHSITATTYEALKITTNDNGNNGPEIQLIHNSASPAANDCIGQLRFSGKDSAGNTDLMGRIETITDSPTSGAETGFLNFATRGQGSFNTIFRIKRRGTASAPSYTTDDIDGLIFDIYNTGNPYPRYMNLIAKSAGDTDSNLSFWTESVGGSPTEKLCITSAGRVGVGISNPHSSYRFDIRHTSNAYLHLGQGDATLGAMGNNTWNALSFQGTNAELGLHKDSSGNFSYIMGTYQGGTAIPIVFRTGNRQERLRITSIGTVEHKGYQGQCFKFNSDFGVGARNVQIWNAANGNWHSFVGTNLTWDGTNYIKPSDNASSNWGNIAGMVFEGSNANNSSGNHPAIRFLVDQPAGNSANFSLGSSKTNAIDQKTAACITSSGNFGIGTENPGSSLVVEGTIIANNGTLQVDKHIVDGTDDWAGASYILHNKRSFTNGSWTNYFKFDRSDTAADNNDCGVFAGHLHIVYMNDRSNSVHTTGYDVFPFIVRGRSNNTVSGNFGSAVVDLHEVIGSSVEVRFDSASASVIYIQIRIYNSDAGGSERLCHAWIDGGGVANLSNRFLFPEITT